MDITHFGSHYMDLLEELMGVGACEEINKRTGVKIRAAYGPRAFSVDLFRGLQLPGNRAYYPKVAAAEVAWMLQGTRDPKLIMEHAPKLWGKFIEQGHNDLTGEQEDQIKAAYGYRWRKAFGRDQLTWAVCALRDDPSNRQCWVTAWDASSDGCGWPVQPKNIPCPVGFSINIIGGRLHMAVFIRSSDVYVGLPYDVMAYSMLAALIGRELGVALGQLHVTLAHAHIYEPHFEMANECLDREWKPQDIPFSGLSISDVEFNPKALILAYSTYAPPQDILRHLPEVVQ